MALRSSKKQETIALPLVAVDPGSSSLKVMAATLTDSSSPEGSTLRILAAEDCTKFRSVQKGIIQNTSNTSYMLRETMLLLQNRMRFQEELPTAFALVGGKSMHCTTITNKRMQANVDPISINMLDQLEDECFRKIRNAESRTPYVAIEARPGRFLLDKEEVLGEPAAGTKARAIEASYSTFYGIEALSEKMTASFERAGKSIEKMFARPSALLEALANEDDEMLGVAIIDFGDETTTISIYKAGMFLSCQVALQGGHHITRDIASLGISEVNAEKLKLKFGSAFENHSNVRQIRIPAEKEGEEPIIVATDFLSTIIVSRLDETMTPIFAELKKYEDQISRVYITGGASKMRDMEAYIKAHTTLPVSYGSHADWLEAGTPQELYAPEYSAVVGALLLGAGYRRRRPGRPIPGTPIKNDPPQKKFGNFIVDLFTNTENQ